MQYLYEVLYDFVNNNNISFKNYNDNKSNSSNNSTNNSENMISKSYLCTKINNISNKHKEKLIKILNNILYIGSLYLDFVTKPCNIFEIEKNIINFFLNNNNWYLDKIKIPIKLNVLTYCDILINVIDLMFVIKGIAIQYNENNNIFLSNITQFCNKFICKILLNDIKLLSYSKINLI